MRGLLWIFLGLGFNLFLMNIRVLKISLLNPGVRFEIIITESLVYSLSHFKVTILKTGLNQ